MFMHRARALLDYRLLELCLIAVYAVYDISVTLSHGLSTLGEWAEREGVRVSGGRSADPSSALRARSGAN